MAQVKIKHCPELLVYDNGGETADRYTILNILTGDYWGASENPYHPQGFGQYCGNTASDYWLNAYGAGWRQRISEKMAIRKAVENFKNEAQNNPAWVGKLVQYSDLPEMVQMYCRVLTDQYNPA